MDKYNTTLKQCLSQEMSNPLFYCDALQTVRKIITSFQFSVLFPKRITVTSFCVSGYDIVICFRTTYLMYIRSVNHFSYFLVCMMSNRWLSSMIGCSRYLLSLLFGRDLHWMVYLAPALIIVYRHVEVFFNILKRNLNHERV